MIYGSVCSGIEAASHAWEPLGWKAAFFSEVEPFPSGVLAHRYPNVPNLGDFTQIGAEHGPVGLLVGGTPCQSFSVAGQRAGLDDPRGNLAIEFLRLAQRLRPTWIVWENVPGVLSSNGGRDFGAFLRLMGECGYGWAYRVMDAQHFGVPQRRRRVFVIGYFGDRRPPEAVLFERESLRRHPAKGKEARKVAPPRIGTLSANGGGTNRPAGNCNELDFCICTPYGIDGELNAIEGLMGTQSSHQTGGWREGMVAQGETTKTGAVSSKWAKGTGGPAGDECYNLVAVQGDNKPLHYTHDYNQDRIYGDAGSSPALTSQDSNRTRNFMVGSSVRRLTPRECERLQGFKDDWTLVPWRGKLAADGPRYKAIGNSMAVPCMRWIGERIMLVSELLRQPLEEAA